MLVHGLGVAGQGLAPSWELFVVAAMAAGAGAGSLDGGANGLVLDVFREGRGRVMNLLHVMFSAGALAAPVTVGALVEAGVPWETLVVATGGLVCLLAVAYWLVPMPSGRRTPRTANGRRRRATDERGRQARAAPAGRAAAPARHRDRDVRRLGGRRLELARPLPGAGARSPPPPSRCPCTGVASPSAGSSRRPSRIGSITCGSRSPARSRWASWSASPCSRRSLPLSIVAFALAGVASGPVFPMIVAIGGERYPERSAAVGGSLTGMAILGSVVYPPAMGFMSVTIGLTAAMLGNVVLAFIATASLVAFGRATRPAGIAK